MYSKCGECKNCGAQMLVPKLWFGIIPPEPIKTCTCASQKTGFMTTGIGTI